MPNLAWWSYLEAVFPDEQELLQQLPSLFEESLDAREVARVPRGSCVVFYGIRLMVRGEDELLEMDADEQRSLSRVSRAGLESYWIPAPLAGKPHSLLIGERLGVFYSEEDALDRVTVFDDAAFGRIRDRTQLILKELGYADPPMLIIQWDWTYPEALVD